MEEEDSDVWSRHLNSSDSTEMDMDTGISCGQTAPARRAVRDLDISPEGGFVYPQRQTAMIELDLSCKRRQDGSSSYPGEETSGVAPGQEVVDGNCNARNDEDLVYDEMLDFLPTAYDTFYGFEEEEESRRPSWACSPPSPPIKEFDAATPLAGHLVLTTAEMTEDAVVKSGSGQRKRSEASVRRTKAMTSVLRMIRSLDLLEEDEEREEAEEGVVVKEDGSGIELEEEEETGQGSSGVEAIDRVAAKVVAWTANHGQLIAAAYRRGVQSAEMRLDGVSHQLTNCKHRLFEVSRDRQVIATYLRRHEQSWSCRHDRLRLEILRLQKLVHDLQKSPDQLEENRQMYEGERGGEGGGGSGTASGTGGAGTGGGRGAVQLGKTEETMDKLLSVIVEHQSRLNELKLTVFAQQQHILSLEEVLRQQHCASLVDEEAETRHQQQQPDDAAAPDAKTRCSRSNPMTKESQKRHDTMEQTADDVTAAAATEITPAMHLPSSPTTAFGNFISSKMSDVLLCDEGDYRLCQTNQPEVATDSTLTSIRCLCHQNGASCSSSAQVQLVGQLPYLMDSPLDTEVAGVLARPKARPFSLADLPYVRHSIAAQRMTPEQTPADIDFLF